ncbi:MAG: NAD(P) transhydrogenase subunit beta [Flammeovirgaceae bacterium]|jgi:H+-translocating NAD(P) transhydrogenase subunit beta|nr:NAD(P) transhydrogenase subunit beta [Flammeovirgaceae bacterium]|tara:strand:- start:407 stop:1786 length:1380 start_codon:yes stop_codon:yes gene_type:complete
MDKILFLISAFLLVWGLRLQSDPSSASKGNKLAGIGMLLAIFSAIIMPLEESFSNLIWVVSPLVLSAIIGFYIAKNIKMTSMPQMVSIFNGLGGLSAVLLSYAEINKWLINPDSYQTEVVLVLIISLFIGSVAFTGSLLAFAKLDGYKWSERLTLPFQHIINIIFIALIIVISFYFIDDNSAQSYLYIIIILSLIYGIFFVAPIGGADMPVVISLLNSFTGITAALTGIIFGNIVMLLGGILVGAAGTILTILMCNAMNRSLLNVLIGGFSSSSSSKEDKEQGDVKEVSDSDFAVQLFYSKQVIIIPGYGLAVAQAQKLCKEIQELLENNDVEVKYAIHPVAGRMPGHMNVLLAEADVDYSKLIELDQANEEFKSTDVAVIIGANDVVNPDAIDDSSSPLFGMPILKVWESTSTVVLKRSMSAGYAGVQNPLFFKENNKMYFGDAKESLQRLSTELKNL